MVPNAADIVRRRWTVTTVLRLTALFLAFGASRPIISWLGEGLSDGDLGDLGYYADRIGLAVVSIFVAGVLFFASGFFARLVVPVRRFMACPKCKHRIEGLTEPRCTECGLALTREFIEHEPLVSRVNSQRPYRVLVFREKVAWFLRVAGIFVLLMAVFWSIATLASGVRWYVDGSGEDYFGYYLADTLSSLLQTLALFAAALVMLIAPKRLARFCVPFRGVDAEP